MESRLLNFKFDGDHENFGLHVDDSVNVPNDQGNVVINIGHDVNEPDILLPPQISNVVKPYQVGGIRFLYDNIIRNFDTPNCGGCVLAHSMGLGKTLQVVAFCEVFLQYTESKTILCVVPVNTIENWVAEFNKWLPCEEAVQPSNKISPRKFHIFTIGSGKKTLTARHETIVQWHEKGGVLVLGYEQFKGISLSGKRNESTEEKMIDMQTILLSTDLIVCDEGHRIKNMNTETAVALNNIHTKRRIVLTGYPIQNNTLEYWCMIDFVHSNYLGSEAEFRHLFQKPIERGHYSNASPDAAKLMLQRSFVMHALLSNIVQRRSHVVFKDLLPNIVDHVILLRLTPLQKMLYQSFLEDARLNNQKISPINGFATCSKIINHPDILYTGASEFEWSKELMKGYTPNLIENSPKMLIFFNLLKEILLLGDRILVFSQSLATLDLIESFLQTNATNNVDWKRDWNYFRMDGSFSSRMRDKLINEFNTNDEILLFLLSTKACSHGINLTAANRVIIFDSGWNPCYEQQALCRVYRHEQKKSCFVYRFIMDKCFEKRVYDRQVNKQGIANRIIDDQNPEPKFSWEDLSNLFPVTDDDDSLELSNFTNNDSFPDNVMETIFKNFSYLMSGPPFLHDTLLTDHTNLKLSRNEQIIALHEYDSQKNELSSKIVATDS